MLNIVQGNSRRETGPMPVSLVGLSSGNGSINRSAARKFTGLGYPSRNGNQRMASAKPRTLTTNEFGKWLRAQREKLKSTLEDMATMLHTHHSTVSRYEHGNGGIPGTEKAASFARLLSPNGDDRYLKEAIEAVVRDDMSRFLPVPLLFVYDSTEAEYISNLRKLDPAIREMKVAEVRELSKYQITKIPNTYHEAGHTATVATRSMVAEGGSIPPYDPSDDPVKASSTDPANGSHRTPTSPASW